MAFDESLKRQVMQLVDEHWAKRVKDQGFAELIGGKEPGHHIADYVDDQTCSSLKVNFATRYEGNKQGKIRARSMGDIWVHCRDIFNPINVKSGLQGMNGQPNVVSMRKLLAYLFQHLIDCYYLLIIKCDVSQGITHKAYFFNLLDWLEFISYDAGPGQIMLREQNFYEAFDSGYMPQERSIQEKTSLLFKMFEEQVQVLISNRESMIRAQREEFEVFMQTTFVVDQSSMRFIP